MKRAPYDTDTRTSFRLWKEDMLSKGCTMFKLSRGSTVHREVWTARGPRNAFLGTFDTAKPV